MLIHSFIFSSFHLSREVGKGLIFTCILLFCVVRSIDKIHYDYLKAIPVNTFAVMMRILIESKHTYHRRLSTVFLPRKYYYYYHI